jgi:hypothetical protein
MPDFDLILLDDEEIDYLSTLRQLSRVHDNPSLGFFFRKTCNALRIDIGQQSSSTRDQLPSFYSINDLIENVSRNPCDLMKETLQYLCHIAIILQCVPN